MQGSQRHLYRVWWQDEQDSREEEVVEVLAIDNIETPSEAGVFPYFGQFLKC